MKQDMDLKKFVDEYVAALRSQLPLRVFMKLADNMIDSTIKDIKQKKVRLFIQDEILMKEARDYVTKCYNKYKYTSSNGDLGICHILLVNFLWKMVNEAEGRYIQDRLISNDEQFAKDFFFGKQPKGLNIDRLKSRLIFEVKETYGITLSKEEVGNIIYSSIWDDGTWKGLKTFKSQASIFCWIETKARRDLIHELRMQKRIKWVPRRTPANTRLKTSKLSEEIVQQIFMEEAVPEACKNIIKDLYINKMTPTEMMKRRNWDEDTYQQNVKRAHIQLIDVLLRSPTDYSDIITDTRTVRIPIPRDEVMDKGSCIAVDDYESSLKDIFGASLSNEEIQQKALQTILDIASHMNCSERDRYLWKCRFIDNKSPATVAKELNLQKSNVNRIFSKMNRVFRKEAQKWYEQRNQEKIHQLKEVKKRI